MIFPDNISTSPIPKFNEKKFAQVDEAAIFCQVDLTAPFY